MTTVEHEVITQRLFEALPYFQALLMRLTNDDRVRIEYSLDDENDIAEVSIYFCDRVVSIDMSYEFVEQGLQLQKSGGIHQNVMDRLLEAVYEQI